MPMMMRITPRMATGFMATSGTQRFAPALIVPSALGGLPTALRAGRSVGLVLQLEVLEGLLAELLVRAFRRRERREPTPLRGDVLGVHDAEATLPEPLLHRERLVAGLVALHRLAQPPLVLLALDQDDAHDARIVGPRSHERGRDPAGEQAGNVPGDGIRGASDLLDGVALAAGLLGQLGHELDGQDPRIVTHGRDPPRRRTWQLPRQTDRQRSHALARRTRPRPRPLADRGTPDS